MSSGNKHIKSIEKLRKVVLKNKATAGTNSHLHKEEINFPLQVADIANFTQTKDMIILRDGLVSILNKQAYLLEKNQKFVTSLEIYLNLPAKLQEIFSFYQFSDNRETLASRDKIIFIDAPIDLLNDKNLKRFIKNLGSLDSHSFFYLNIVDFNTRFPGFQQLTLSTIFNNINKLKPIEKDDLFDMEPGTEIKIIKDSLLFGFSAIEYFSVMTHYKLDSEPHTGVLQHSYPMTPYSKFEIFKGQIIEKSFYKTNEFIELLEKSLKKSDGETIYHLLGHYFEKDL